MSRVQTIVEKLHVSESWVIRRAVLRGSVVAPVPAAAEGEAA